MKMLRLAVAVVLLILASSTGAVADITIKVTMSVSGSMPFPDTPFVIYVKGTKLRADTKWAGTDTSVLIDLGVKQPLWMDHEAKVVGADPPGEPLSFGTVARGPMECPDCKSEASMKPNGQTKDLLNQTCNAFNVSIKQQVKLKGVTVIGGSGSNELTAITSGPVWVAKGGADLSEYQTFLKTASTAGILVWPLGWGDPIAQKSKAKAMIEMQTALAEVGVPLLLEWQTGLGGSPEKQTLTMKVTEISTASIPDETFAVPAGYTKRKK